MLIPTKLKYIVVKHGLN